jgi:acyl carrier protein
MTWTEKVEAEVRSVLAALFAADPRTVDADASLRDDIGADSLGLTEALAALEDRLGVLLPDDAGFLANLTTVGDLVGAFAGLEVADR